MSLFLLYNFICDFHNIFWISSFLCVPWTKDVVNSKSFPHWSFLFVLPFSFPVISSIVGKPTRGTLDVLNRNLKKKTNRQEFLLKISLREVENLHCLKTSMEREYQNNAHCLSFYLSSILRWILSCCDRFVVKFYRGSEALKEFQVHFVHYG